MFCPAQTCACRAQAAVDYDAAVAAAAEEAAAGSMHGGSSSGPRSAAGGSRFVELPAKPEKAAGDKLDAYAAGVVQGRPCMTVDLGEQLWEVRDRSPSPPSPTACRPHF